MTTKEIKEILKLVSDLDLKEVRIKDKDFEIRIRTDKDQPVHVVSGGSGTSVPIPIAHPSSIVPMSEPNVVIPTGGDQPSVEEVVQETNNYIEVKSPMVGTFYRSSTPEKPAYVQVGDTIAKGDVVCIIEAMKLFNEIETEVSGKIVKVLIDDSTPVEYDQVLFLVDGDTV